jgi:hypothetical protein
MDVRLDELMGIFLCSGEKSLLKIVVIFTYKCGFFFFCRRNVCMIPNIGQCKLIARFIVKINEFARPLDCTLA